MSQEQGQERTANVVLRADVDPYRQSIQAAGTETSRLTEKVDKLTRSLADLSKSAGKKLTFFGAGTVAGVTATTAAFAAFDKQMTALKVNAEVTGRSYEKMTNSVNELRKSFGITTASAAQLNKTILGFQDQSKSVDSLAKTFVRLGAAVGEAPEAMAQGMLQLQRSMGTSQRDTARYSNVLTDLSVKSGVAASSILEFSQTIAPIGRIAGMQQAEIMGISTAFNKAGQDGYLAANAFNKMLSDIMQATQSGSPELAKYANLIGLTTDQFKSMGKTEAITSIFDELNRLGPNAIQILNRMGLDGMRMQRAIAGVSQQTGGIGNAVSQAVAAYNDPNGSALKKGSDVALDGVADRMKRLSESTKELGESMGAPFQGPAKAFLSTMQSITNTVSDLMSSKAGKVLAWVGALGGAFALAGGPLVKFATTLGALALGRQTTTNWLTQGYMDRRNERLGNDAPISPSGVRYTSPGATNIFQRGMYRFGYERLGGAIPPLTVSRALGTVPWATGHFMNMWRGTLGGLTHPFDPGARPRLFATDYERATGQTFGRYFSNSMIAGSAGAGPVTRSAIAGGRFAMLPVNWASRAMGFAGDGALRSPGFGAPFSQQAGFAARAGLATVGSLAGATAGVGAIAGRAGLGALRAGVGAIGTGIGSLGPLGVAMLGVPLAMAARSAVNSRNNINVGEGAENISLMSSYKAAVGEATSATQDFASALHRATVEAAPVTKRQALIVSEQDKILAQQNPDKFSDKRIKSVTFEQAQNILAGQLRGDASPKVIQELKLDLIKRFGYDKAEQALAGANSSRGFSTSSYVADISRGNGFGADNFFGLRAGKNASDQYGLLEGQYKDMRTQALAQGGSAAGGEVQKVLTNQFLESFFKNYRGKSAGDVNSGLRFIDKTLFNGGIDIGDEGNQALAGSVNKLVDWQQFAVDAHDVGKAFEKGRIPGLQNFYGQLLRSDDKRTKEGFDTYLNNQGLDRTAAAKQIRAGKGSLFNDTMDTAKLYMGSTVTAAEMTQQRIYNNTAGRIFQGDRKTMDAINTAVATPGNQNNQIQAMDAMVHSLKKAGLSFGEVERALIEFQGAVQAPEDPLYALAAAARGISAQNLQFKLPYMSRADQFGVIASRYGGVMEATAPQEGKAITPEAQEERKKARQDFAQYKLNTRNFYMQMVVQQREFNISRERSNFDFYQVQLPRMEYQFNLSRERAWEDYNLSRARSEEEFGIQRARSAQQFAISEKDAYFDFHLSRKRAEEDFAHQQVLLARQAAQGMYEVYQRVLVQRTWAGPSLLQNSQDQLQRMRQQNKDLAEARKMGLSKDAIQQLGFTDAANQQQLSRFLEDARDRPNLVGQFNKNASQRLKAGKELATDPANPQWEEMQRQFKLTMSRGADDFARAMGRNRRNYAISMKQSQEDFGRAMDNNAADMKRAMSRSADDYNLALQQMKDDYQRQQDRAAKDLKRSQKELTWSLNEVLTKATEMLAGKAGKQAQIIKDYVNDLREFLASNKLEVIIGWKGMPGVTRTTDPLDRSSDNRAKPRNHVGGLYRGAQDVTVGETAPELVLPLNRHGSDFMASVLKSYASEAKRTQVSGYSIPAGNHTYNYRIDKSTNFTGPVQVSGVENPRELAEKARVEARRKALTAGVR